MADSKISDLTAVTDPAGSLEFAVNQAGTSRKIASAALSTLGSYSPGAFTVQDGGFAIFANRLILTSTQRATVQGNGTVRIID